MLYATWEIKTMFPTCPGFLAFCGETMQRSPFYSKEYALQLLVDNILEML
jgi:hypothetical protein